MPKNGKVLSKFFLCRCIRVRRVYAGVKFVEPLPVVTIVLLTKGSEAYPVDVRRVLEPGVIFAPDTIFLNKRPRLASFLVISEAQPGIPADMPVVAILTSEPLRPAFPGCCKGSPMPLPERPYRETFRYLSGQIFPLRLESVKSFV